MIMDTGASVTCIGPSLCESLHKPNLKGYITTNPLNSLRTITVKVQLGSDEKALRIIVNTEDDEPIIVLNKIHKFGISLNINQIADKQTGLNIHLKVQDV
ncbi:hypothetical protein RF11_15171 [Thelohanellus kitauei]|uniref:Uncharacterized protein n=1 Tax=Thelohanellus kitauei TaxID=669202 RepID=A0A0C2JTE1_THEKT|nr:hypothetical protein RF11_15171 [Thelohanellus kitauei]